VGGLLRPLTRRLNRRRRRAWERRTQRRYLAHSEQIYDSISQGGTDWLTALR
jgi:hypothetical protein